MIYCKDDYRTAKELLSLARANLEKEVRNFEKEMISDRYFLQYYQELPCYQKTDAFSTKIEPSTMAKQLIKDLVTKRRYLPNKLEGYRKQYNKLMLLVSEVEDAAALVDSIK
jgi:hypothetical protein